MTRLRADILLLFAALIWGTAFIAQKTGNDLVGPMQFIGGRFALSALLLAPFALFEARRNAGLRLTRHDWLQAVGIGLCMFLGSSAQQIGMLTTSVTNAGFITALYIAFVPFVAWMLARTPIRPAVLLACAVSLAGAWLLTDRGASGHIEPGDALVLAGSFLFALHIALVSQFLARTHRPYFLAFLQFAIAAALGLTGAPVFETIRLDKLVQALPAIAYAGLLSGGIGFTLQIVAQRYTPAAEAALIMSLESVFAAGAAVILLGETLTVPALIGCGMILAGVLMVEIGPALPRRRRAVANS